MARKSRSFKQVSNVHIESVAQQDWSSFLKIQKQNDSLKSAYVEKVRISWILDSDENQADNGILFVASTDDALDSSIGGGESANDGAIISASASRGGGGVVTLDIRRRIEDNYTGSNVEVMKLLKGSGVAPIYLHMRNSTTGGGTVNYYLVVETWGRWHEAESL